MKLTRGKRIALELLGPAFFGALIFWAYSCLSMAVVRWGGMRVDLKLGDMASWGLVMLLYAYIFAGIPSLVYAGIMELAFAKGLKPRSWQTVGLSTTLGLISGAAIILMMGGDRDLLMGLAEIEGVGLLVGFLLGFLILKYTPKEGALCP